MKIWIICTGKKEGLRPVRCSAGDFDALSLRAQEEDPGPRQEKKLPWEGKPVLAAPVPPRKGRRRCSSTGEKSGTSRCWPR